MKFTKLQQKWTLTTGLMVALGFSLSTHFSPKSGPEYAQLGATQEQIEPVMLAQNKELHVTHMSSNNQLPPPPVKQKAEEKKEEVKKTEANVFEVNITRENEKQKIIFESSNTGKTKVIYPACKIVQKNINCSTGNCVLYTSLMDVDMNSGIAELVNIFSTTHGKCGATEENKATNSTTASATNAEKSETSASIAATELSEEDKHKEIFEKLKVKCDKQPKDSQLDCRIDGLTKLLTDAKITYTKSVVLDFFKSQIEVPMKNALDSYDYMNPFAQHEYIEKTRNLSEKIKEMQGEVRDVYSYLRERVGNMSIRAIAEKALEVNTYRQNGDVYSESAALTQLQILNGVLPASNRMGLMSAVSNNLINGRYASNIYNSVGNLGTNILNNISQISEMNPMAAELLLNSGLSGLDSWNYQRGVLNSLDVGPQLQRLGDGTILLSDRFSGRSRRGNFFDRDSGRLGLLDSQGYTRRGRRGTGRLSGSSLFQNSAGLLNTNRLGLSTDGLLGQPQVYQTGVSAVGNSYLPQSGRVIRNGSRRVFNNQF